MARILVTGADGFVGRSLVPYLRAAGHVVTRVVRTAGDVDDVAVGNAAAFECWPSVLSGIDVAVHLAARAHVLREATDQPLEEFRRINVAATVRLARAAAAAGTRRFIFMSSIGVNGVATTSGRFSESDLPNPSEPYAISKWEAERALMEIGERSAMQITRVRPPLIIGAGVKGNLHRLLKLVDSGMPLPLGGIRNQRSLVALDDLCELLATCISHPRAGNELFLAADPREISTPELLRAMAKGLGRAARIFTVPEPILQFAAGILGLGAEVQRMVSSLRVDATRAREVLGWAATGGLDNAIRAMTTCYRRETRA